MLGIFCKASFMPAVTSFHQVHALNTNAHTYLRCDYATSGTTGVETLLLLTA